MNVQHAVRAVALVSALAFATPVRAEQAPFGGPPASTDFRDGRDHRQGMSERGIMGMIDRLDLSREQRTRIHMIAQRSMRETRSLHQDLRDARRTLMSEAERGGFDEGRIRDLARRQSRIQTELLVARARMTSRIFAVLTPPQRDQLRSLRDRFDRGGARYGSRSGSWDDQDRGGDGRDGSDGRDGRDGRGDWDGQGWTRGQ